MAEVDQDAVRAVLDGLEYPCSRHDVIEHAAAQGADDDVLGHLCSLPDREYAGFEAVDAALARA